MYEVYKMCKVCKVYKVLFPPAPQASYPTSVGFIGIEYGINIYQESMKGKFRNFQLKELKYFPK